MSIYFRKTYTVMYYYDYDYVRYDYCIKKLPKEGKNIKKHKHGTKALRMNDMIYLDLECLDMPKYDLPKQS